MLSKEGDALLPLSRANEVILEKRYSCIPKPAGLRCDPLAKEGEGKTPSRRFEEVPPVLENI